MHKLGIRLNGVDAAFLPVFRSRARLPRVCTSVSVFVIRDRRRVHHTLLDIGRAAGTRRMPVRLRRVKPA
jgi:hypothetical protein